MRCKIERRDVGEPQKDVLFHFPGLGWIHNGDGGYHTVKGTRLERRQDGTFILLTKEVPGPLAIPARAGVPRLPARVLKFFRAGR